MPIRQTAIVALVCFVAAFRAASAQQSGVQPDSVIPPIPSAAAAQAAVAPTKAKSRDRLHVVFYGALGAAAATAAVLHVDPDSGGYHDGWNTATDFPDKAVHALAAWAITNVGIDLGARPRHAALAVCAAGTAFEFAQGYVSVYDIVADCAGAAGAAAWQSWRAGRRIRTRTVTPQAASPAR